MDRNEFLKKLKSKIYNKRILTQILLTEKLGNLHNNNLEAKKKSIINRSECMICLQVYK